jgi:small subunit ribosomal protein S9
MPKAKETTIKKKIQSKKKNPSLTLKKKTKEKKEKYFEAVGRRKTSTARVRLFTNSGTSKKDSVENILINGKPYRDYFSILSLYQKITAPLEELSLLGKFKISVFVKGGGVNSQAEAVRHGIARALVLVNSYFRKKLRKSGFLTRDPRMRERKKFGLKRARRAPQWSKR